MNKIEQTLRGKIFLALLAVFIISTINAGVGIKWDEGSALLPEEEKTCLTYSVYNPFLADTYVKISLSEELQGIMTLQDTEAVLIPGGTSSENAIPIEFCFKVPKVYERDFAISGKFIDKLDCSNQERVEYAGDVIVSSAAAPSSYGGFGGSASQMSVSAPLNVRVLCEPYSWNYTPVFVIVALVSGVIVFWVLFTRDRKPKSERVREKMRKLRAELQRSKRK